MIRYRTPRAPGRALQDDAPPAPTGSWPGPVWADAAVGAALAEEPPPKPSGCWPGPVWAQAAGTGRALEAEGPPRPTGSWPASVWATGLSHAASAGPPASADAPGYADVLPSSAAPAVPVSPVTADEALRPEDRWKEDGYTEALVLPGAEAEDALPPGLTLQEMYRIVRVAAEADSGAELYAAVLDDAAHAARHGLAFGLALFTQASGRLGSVLRLTQQRDAALFDRLFGPDSLALLQVTNAATAAERTALVSGRPLTDPEWTARFRAAGAEEACRNAQNEEAIARQLRPLIRFAFALGLDTDRGLAMAYDRVSVLGLGGGVRWLVDAAGLLAAPSDVQVALAAVGAADVAGFQASTGWIAPTGQAGAETVAALLEAVRARGAMPLPGCAEVRARLVAAAQGPARRRLLRLSRAAGLTDTPYRQGSRP
jgi:hypothetical protein